MSPPYLLAHWGLESGWGRVSLWSFSELPLSRLGLCLDRDVGAVVALAREDDRTIDQCIEGMVLADTNPYTWVMLRTTLADDDIPSLSVLTTEELYPKSLTFRFASVLGATYTFFMCHCLCLN